MFIEEYWCLENVPASCFSMSQLLPSLYFEYPPLKWQQKKYSIQITVDDSITQRTKLVLLWLCHWWTILKMHTGTPCTNACRCQRTNKMSNYPKMSGPKGAQILWEPIRSFRIANHTIHSSMYLCAMFARVCECAWQCSTLQNKPKTKWFSIGMRWLFPAFFDVRFLCYHCHSHCRRCCCFCCWLCVLYISFIKYIQYALYYPRRRDEMHV